MPVTEGKLAGTSTESSHRAGYEVSQSAVPERVSEKGPVGWFAHLTGMESLIAYPTDLTDTEWAILAPLIPPAQPGGRPRRQDMRAVVNAI